jgi:hypothetical protein
MHKAGSIATPGDLANVRAAVPATRCHPTNTEGNYTDVVAAAGVDPVVRRE